MSSYDVQRAHYRVYYPESARPVYIPGHLIDGYPVLDCSERGLRYRGGDIHLPRVGDEARGTLRFPDGEEVDVSGVVVRVQDRQVALHLRATPIPWRVLLRQQLFLRREYPLCA